MTQNAIHVDRLSRSFHDLRAVDEISFDVGSGELFGFLGPNGAGKSTAINMLCTLLRPTSGSASVAGFDIQTQKMEVRRRIGLVFQETTLDEYLTAEQNLQFHAFAYALPRSVWKPRIRELMELMELWERRKDKTRTFSGGMRRRLELARGLLHRPEVLFLDEPTLGLDPQTRHRIWEHLLALRQREGLSIFLTTHYMDEAEHCDRIAVIDHGRIIALDTPDALKDATGGDVVTLRTPDIAVAIEEVARRYGVSPTVSDEGLRFHVARGDEFLPDFVRTFPYPLLAVSVHRPTLDDVFLNLTGHQIREAEQAGPSMMMRMRMHG